MRIVAKNVTLGQHGHLCVYWSWEQAVTRFRQAATSPHIVKIGTWFSFSMLSWLKPSYVIQQGINDTLCGSDYVWVSCLMQAPVAQWHVAEYTDDNVTQHGMLAHRCRRCWVEGPA